MKLTIHGSIHELGRYAKFDNVHEDLPSLVGKRITQAVPDTAILIKEVGEGFVVFDYIRFRDAEEVSLHLGEEKSFSHEGNAYGYEVHFALEA